MLRCFNTAAFGQEWFVSFASPPSNTELAYQKDAFFDEPLGAILAAKQLRQRRLGKTISMVEANDAGNYKRKKGYEGDCPIAFESAYVEGERFEILSWQARVGDFMKLIAKGFIVRDQNGLSAAWRLDRGVRIQLALDARTVAVTSAKEEGDAVCQRCKVDHVLLTIPLINFATASVKLESDKRVLYTVPLTG